ncbi:MAG: hypothetical protein QM730_28015 [Anaerolineales bacterium]
MLIVFSVVTVATISGRKYTYGNLLSILLTSLPLSIQSPTTPNQVFEYLVPFLVAVTVCEVFFMLKDTAQQHIHRLETINTVSRQIMLTLDKEQSIALLDAAIKNALEADTYFVGIIRDNEIHLELFYDDGEYFNGTHVPFEGTLSGWVVKNQKELFLPDLRDDVQLEGVKGSLSARKRPAFPGWVCH